jgi:tetratricopeptide (TPR) repeat protein
MRLPVLAIALCLFASPVLADNAVPVTKAESESAPVPAHEPPLRADMGLSKAEAQLAEGKYMQAIETLGGVLARRPGDADAETYVGYAWMRLGDFRQAAEYFDLAIKYDPRHLGANAYRAELYLQAGDHPRAMEQLQALRLICAGTPCAELDRVQAALNNYKIPQPDPNASQQRQPDPNAPANENR